MSAYTAQEVAAVWTLVYRCKECGHEQEYTSVQDMNHILVTHMSTHPKPGKKPELPTHCRNYVYIGVERFACQKKYGHGEKHKVLVSDHPAVTGIITMTWWESIQ